MARTSKRTSLACLKKKRLTLVARDLELDVTTTEPKDALVDARARAKSLNFQGLLERLAIAEARLGLAKQSGKPGVLNGIE